MDAGIGFHTLVLLLHMGLQQGRFVEAALTYAAVEGVPRSPLSLACPFITGKRAGYLFLAEILLATFVLNYVHFLLKGK